ncbi:MAG: dTDP-4-dehydrorhamnose reductase [Promethearchaeota archaeon]
MKLLITGASGLLGSKLCELAIRKKHEVYSAYNQHKPLYGTPIQFDVSDKNAVEKTFEKTKPEAVVHAAALTNVDKCELERELAWKINADGTKNIAELCKEHRAFLVYISTDYVFGGEKGMYKETDRPAPINYYGLTKLKGEESVKNLANEHCIARSSVIYGSIPATGKINFALWLLYKLKRKEKVEIVTDQWNSPTLNINLANMVLEALEQRLTEIFHLAGATRLSRYEFARLLAETFNLDTNLIEPVSSKEISWTAKRPKDSSLNVDKALQTLRNKPLKIHKALEKMKEDIEKVSV